jgi:two-component system phosphate regulon response regulator PhoB
MLGPELVLLMSAAKVLRENEIDVYLLSPTEEKLNELRALLPDVIVATDGLSDIELLRICRSLRGNVGSQQVASLVVVATTDATGPLTNGQPMEHERRAGEELAAAIRQSLKTAQVIRSRRDYVSYEGLKIDRRRFSAVVNGADIGLTTTEFRILWTLAHGEGRVFSRTELGEVCGVQNVTEFQRTIDVHIRAIRRKLGDVRDLVETVRGIGYRFAALPTKSAVSDFEVPVSNGNGECHSILIPATNSGFVKPSGAGT